MFGRVTIAATVVIAGCTTFGTDPPLDAEGGAPTRDASVAVDHREAGAGDAAVDAAGNDGDVLLDGAAWSSPNDASWSVTPLGTTITGFATNANHPIIVWTGSSKIPGNDYTVAATVLSAFDNSSREFGLFVRGTVAGGTVFGSAYYREPKTFLGAMTSLEWNPLLLVLGASYAYA